MKIFGWAADDAGPSFYRLRVPLLELQAQTDHHVEISCTMPDWVMEEADVVVGQRVSQPGATSRWLRMASGMHGHRPLLVFEIDDNLWEVEHTNGPAWKFYGRNPEQLRNLTACAKASDVCTVSTEPLADVVRRINPNVVVLPNQLPASAFAPSCVGTAVRPVRIGWHGGASHLADVEEMAPALRQHFRRRPTDRFLNFGTVFESVRKAVGPALESWEWTQDLNEHYARVANLDIGLAPLRPSIFNQSKSELKFLEYAAAGAATIATNGGPYARVIEQGVTGLLVDTTHQWVSQLGLLSRDLEIRADLALAARRYALTRSIEQHWKSWLDVYEQA
jgi:glycosyltransferase involved in cell wall biosynthesis